MGELWENSWYDRINREKGKELRGTCRVYLKSLKGNLNVKGEGEWGQIFWLWRNLWEGGERRQTQKQGCKKWVWWKKAGTGLSLDRLRWGDSVMEVGDREQEREGWGWACCQGCMKVVLSYFLKWMGKPGYSWFWWVIETEGKRWWKMREVLCSLKKANSSDRCYSSGTRLIISRYVNSWRWWWWAKIQVTIVGKAEKKTSLKRQRILGTKMKLMYVRCRDWGYQQVPGEKGKEREEMCGCWEHKKW